MLLDLFHEAFFFLNRRQAEKLRLVCRTFDVICTGLRDVHGYRLRIDSVDMKRTDDWSSGSAEYSAYVWAYGRRHVINGSDEELASGLKAALAVSNVYQVTIYSAALSESLCADSAVFFAGVSVERVELVGNGQSAYYQTVTSSKLQNCFLSFDAIEKLQLWPRSKFLDEDLTDDFILRCRAKPMITLQLGYERELKLQEGSDEELLQRFHAIKPSLISSTRSDA